MDTGGTFTDFVAVDKAGRCRIHKRPSTPDDPARAVLEGLDHLLGDSESAEITYGSTVATNAVLERKGARVVVLTTAGFEDLIEIGRQQRPDIYSLTPRKPVPLVPRARRVGVAERLLFDGTVATALTDAELVRVGQGLAKLRADSVAICFLHSYAEPLHERVLAEALRAQGYSVSVSHELIAEYREYERLSTTVLNAYVAPLMERHLARLAARTGGHRLRVLQSSGGAISVETASREAVRTLLSGPAGGVVGAVQSAARIGESRLLTLDMGGTSTDVSLIDRVVPRHTEWAIDRLPVKIPAIDIHTVGAGGGSIARVDAGGALKVGPDSAGANPGPACYGRGVLPTVTDADVVLGRLVPDAFLGGAMSIDTERAKRAVADLAAKLDMDVVGAAEGIVRVVNAGMERAMRAISVERGWDPREFALVSFGGAAGMHACELAESLEMRKVLVPLNPGVLSAWGALRAEVERSYVQTVRQIDPHVAALDTIAASMRRRARREIRVEARVGKIETSTTADVRYRGQSYELEVPLSRQLRRDFEKAHERLYGYSDEQRSIEVVNLRVVGSIARRPVVDRVPERAAARSAIHRLYWGGRWVEAKHMVRPSLSSRRCAGPIVVTEVSATTMVPPGWTVRAAASGDLLIERKTSRGK